jgi:hypothetical protein
VNEYGKYIEFLIRSRTTKCSLLGRHVLFQKVRKRFINIQIQISITLDKTLSSAEALPSNAIWVTVNLCRFISHTFFNCSGGTDKSRRNCQGIVKPRFRQGTSRIQTLIFYTRQLLNT